LKKKVILSLFILVLAIILVRAGIFAFGQIKATRQAEADLENSVVETSKEKSDISAYAQLNDIEKKIYVSCCQSIEAFENDVEIAKLDASIDEVTHAFTALEEDNPQYFWVVQYSYEYDQKSQFVKIIHVMTNGTQAEILSRQSIVEEWAQNLKTNLPEDADDFTKALYYHDILVDTVTYDASVDENQNLYSVAAYQRSVCAGYAKAYAYLLQQENIPARYVTGTIEGTDQHAFNLIVMDNDPYYVDVTFDDPQFANGEVVDFTGEYTYFGLTTAEITRNHTIDGNLPICTATKNNYFIHENCDFDFDEFGEKARFTQMVREDLIKGQSEVVARFKTEEMAEQALTLLLNAQLNFSSVAHSIDKTFNVLHLAFQ